MKTAAGMETTGNTMAWALYNISMRPEIMAGVEAELDSLGLLKTKDRPQNRDVEYDDLNKLVYLNACIKVRHWEVPVRCNYCAPRPQLLTAVWECWLRNVQVQNPNPGVSCFNGWAEPKANESIIVQEMSQVSGHFKNSAMHLILQFSCRVRDLTCLHVETMEVTVLLSRGEYFSGQQKSQL